MLHIGRVPGRARDRLAELKAHEFFDGISWDELPTQPAPRGDEWV